MCTELSGSTSVEEVRRSDFFTDKRAIAVKRSTTELVNAGNTRNHVAQNNKIHTAKNL